MSLDGWDDILNGMDEPAIQMGADISAGGNNQVKPRAGTPTG